jgi:hypothetical protein
MENTEQLTQAWKDALTGKTIEDIRLVMITEHYLEYEDDRIWLSDGGFEIQCSDAVFSFCFHDESGNFACHTEALETYLEGFDHYDVDLSPSSFYDRIKGAVITDLKVRWSGYEIHDYDGSVMEKVDIPVEFVVTLDNGMNIQLATIEFTLNPETMSFSKLDYNIEGNMLVCLGDVFEIPISE